MFWAMFLKRGGTLRGLERDKSSASLYSAHGNSIVTPQNRQTDDKNSSTAGNGVSRVHLQMCGEVLRCLGSDTKDMDRSTRAISKEVYERESICFGTVYDMIPSQPPSWLGMYYT